MAETERRQARLRKIRAETFPKLVSSGSTSVVDDDNTPSSPETHHVIGKTENLPVDIGVFFQENKKDPAFKVQSGPVYQLIFVDVKKNFISKLKQHLLPRIRLALMADGFTPDDSTVGDWEKVFLKHNRIYAHHTMRINFTTYDVRRTDDVINTHGPRYNVMLLNPDISSSEPDSEEPEHPFLYAKVLGIFHANVTYHGEGNRDCHPRRIEIIWVRWYENDKIGSWKPQRLDQVCFPSVLDDDSFGFIDPADILRSCHIIPAFNMGMALLEGVPGCSSRAQDVDDWKSYYVNR